jgi:Mg/Co/Ni transporter MgtE
MAINLLAAALSGVAIPLLLKRLASTRRWPAAWC